jgi:choline dehydrogenase-like flavoprotein
MKFQTDEDGGFIVEAATVQDPIGFAASLSDEGGPLWGQRLVDATRRYRYWTGVLAMVNDENNGRVEVTPDGGEAFAADFAPREQERIDSALEFSRKVVEAAGAKQVAWTGIVSTHVQGTCRMGTDPARSVTNENGESHDVRRLFVGDGSLVPRTLSVNPSLTIMALANRVAEHIDADPNGYLEKSAAGVAAGV